MLKTVQLLHIFVETFIIGFLMISLEQQIFEIELFWNIINVFAATFD